MSEYLEFCPELLPCPFCGFSRPDMRRYMTGPLFRNYWMYYAWCPKCRCYGPGFDGVKDREVAIKLWNERAYQTRTQGRK